MNEAKPLPIGALVYELTREQDQLDRVLPAGTQVVLLASSTGGEWIACVVEEWGTGEKVLVENSAVKEIGRHYRKAQ